MNKQDFMLFMKKIVNNEWLLKAYQMNTNFSHYLVLYNMILENKDKTKPNLLEVAKNIYQSCEEVELDKFLIKANEYREKDYTFATKLLLVLPAKRILKDIFFGALYTIEVDICATKNSFVDVLFKILESKYAPFILVSLCRPKGIYLDEQIFSTFSDAFFIDLLDEFVICKNKIIIEDDMTLQELSNKEQKIVEDWKRFYTETKYCLGE